MNYCSNCGERVTVGIPPGDHHQRYICNSCGIIHYQNPRMVVGTLPRWQGKVLMCKRANEPRIGKWTLPAGYLENGESAEEGAVRETSEEANAEIEIVRLLSLYSIPHIGQVYLLFLADLKTPSFSPGAESERLELFDAENIPWDEIAFPAVRFTLEKYFAHEKGSADGVYIGRYLKSSF